MLDVLRLLFLRWQSALLFTYHYTGERCCCCPQWTYREGEHSPVDPQRGLWWVVTCMFWYADNVLYKFHPMLWYASSFALIDCFWQLVVPPWWLLQVEKLTWCQEGLTVYWLCGRPKMGRCVLKPLEVGIGLIPYVNDLYWHFCVHLTRYLNTAIVSLILILSKAYVLCLCPLPQFKQCVECVGHTGPVCAVDAIHLDNNKLLIASTTSDSTVKLWLYTGSKGKRCLFVPAID